MSGIYDKRQIPDDLQQYFVRAEIGLEQTPEQYVAAMVEVFRCVRDVLADDGTLWLNIGDSYASHRDGKATPDTTRGDSTGTLVPKGSARNRMAATFAGSSVKHKDLIGIPWMLAFALRADGWYLRQDIVWSKPNPMPESVRDRCTKAHEYLFLLSKSERYFFDSEAMKEPAAESSIKRWAQDVDNQRGSDRVPGKTNGTMKAVGGPRSKREESNYDTATRNRRSVWTVATCPYKGAHFATFPPKLIQPCILAGSKVGDMVLDPFMGSGTTAFVAKQLNRQYIGCELNPEYKKLQQERLDGLGGLF